MALPQISNAEAGSSVRTKLNDILLGGVATTRSLGAGAGTITPTARWIDITGTAASGFDLTIANGAVVGELIIVAVGAVTLNDTVRLVDAAAVVIVGAIIADRVYFLRWSGTTWLNAGRVLRNTNPLGAVASDAEALAGVVTDKALVPANLAAVRAADALTVSPIEPEQINGSTSLSLAQQWLRKGSGGNILETRNFLIALNSTPANPLTITVPASESISAPGAAWVIYRPAVQTGAVTIVPEAGTVNGGASVAMAGGRALVSVQIVSNPGTAPDILVKGDTAEANTLYAALNLNAQTIIPGAPIELALVADRTFTSADSGKTFVVTDRTASSDMIVPAGLGAGWEATVYNIALTALPIDGPGGTNVSLDVGEVATIKFLTATVIRVAKGATTQIN